MTYETVLRHLMAASAAHMQEGLLLHMDTGQVVTLLASVAGNIVRDVPSDVAACELRLLFERVFLSALAAPLPPAGIEGAQVITFPGAFR